MEYPRDFCECLVSNNFGGCREESKRDGCAARMAKYVFIFGLLALGAVLAQAPSAFGQAQSTISCPAGHGYWDVLSVMMMDPGLAPSYHMEGTIKGVTSSYVYTLWEPEQSKVYYVKNPQGNPWDINLYDSNYIYQWITELGEFNGVDHWNDPTSCRKFNNGSQSNTGDRSMRWAARCAVPGGANSAFWNGPPSIQPNNTNYYTYVGQVQEPSAQNLNYSLLEIKPPGTIEITDHRSVPPRPFSITTLPLQYTYSCTVSGNVNSCKSREVFEYGVDSDVNPVDKIKHTYGWVRWRLYVNTTGGKADTAAVWVLSNTTTSDQLVLGKINLNFQCF